MFYTWSLPSRAALSLSLDHNLTHKNTENSRPLSPLHTSFRVLGQNVRNVRWP